MNIVITGSSGGIGSYIKATLVKNNINVIDINSKDIDLSKPFTTNISGVDGLIHCAGVNNLKPYTGIVKEEYEKLFHVNTYSFLSLCQQVKFNKGSNIIAIGSLYSFITKENRLQYTSSKHALLGMVKTLALEMSPQQVKVNMISPGFVDTEMTRKNNTPERIKELGSMVPLGLTPPEAFGDLCLFLVTKNTGITGQNLIVDGGYSCKSY